jgi:hypothetical protein
MGTRDTARAAAKTAQPELNFRLLARQPTPSLRAQWRLAERQMPQPSKVRRRLDASEARGRELRSLLVGYYQDGKTDLRWQS